jgi:hypothetical protein
VQASTESAALKNYVCLKKVGKSVRTWISIELGSITLEERCRRSGAHRRSWKDAS